MSPKIGEHIYCGDQHGIYVTENFVISHRDGTLEKESLDSYSWRNYEVYASAFYEYHVVAEELYQQYRGKKYSPACGFINDVITKTHAKSRGNKAVIDPTAGVGSSIYSAGIESCEIVTSFVGNGSNIVTQTARAVGAVPFVVGFTVVKAPILFISKIFNW